jgi:hypothetical protein
MGHAILSAESDVLRAARLMPYPVDQPLCTCSISEEQDEKNEIGGAGSGVWGVPVVGEVVLCPESTLWPRRSVTFYRVNPLPIRSSATTVDPQAPLGPRGFWGASVSDQFMTGKGYDTARPADFCAEDVLNSEARELPDNVFAGSR